jgi:hypothetical protein
MVDLGKVQMRHALGVILLLLAGTAQAIPVTWTLDAVFEDGGTATGTFVYDAATNGYTGINLSSTDYLDGEFQYGGEFYYVGGSPPTSSRLDAGGDSRQTDNVAGLILNWNGNLTNTGGTYGLIVPSSEMYGFYPAFRVVTSGTVSAVPIPAAVWLFGSALAGLGWMRRRVN